MIAKEGYSTIFVVSLFSLFLIYISGWTPVWIASVLIVVAVVLTALVIYFFRDPERKTPDDDSLIISPADGKVVQIRTESENEYLKSEVTRISIFLSPLNVHVNRVPVTGKLEYLKYYPGKYLMAWEDHASEENERAHFGVLHASGQKMMFKQITGFLARRIVYNIEEGDDLIAGERFGIMKFGSRMDLLFPAGSVEITVKEGDTTRAGESIIGKLQSS